MKDKSQLAVGDKAPDFTLPDATNTPVKLSKVAAPVTILFFYPKDDTPGCTIEAKEFSDSLAAFEKAGAVVIGISGGDSKSKTKFCTKHKLKVRLLSDTDFAVAKAYGSFGEKTFMGRKYMGIFRNTFVIDKSRRVLQVFEGIKPEGHAGELLKLVKGGVMSGTEKIAKAAKTKSPRKASTKSKLTSRPKSKSKVSTAKKAAGKK